MFDLLFDLAVSLLSPIELLLRPICKIGKMIKRLLIGFSALAFAEPILALPFLVPFVKIFNGKRVKNVVCRMTNKIGSMTHKLNNFNDGMLSKIFCHIGFIILFGPVYLTILMMKWSIILPWKIIKVIFKKREH